MSAHRTLVKICGLCSAEDALAAAAAGADAVGVVLAESPRRVGLDEAARILAHVPPSVARVGVFVDADPDEIRRAIEVLGLKTVQLHGSESPQLCGSLPARVIKAFRVGPGFDAAAVEPYRPYVAAVLLDGYAPGAAGGTGRTFDWDVARAVHDPALVLAGGLTPDNVAEAVRRVRPYVVDTSSGVESAPRVKDHARIRAFVAAVREADRTIDEETPR